MVRSRVSPVMSRWEVPAQVSPSVDRGGRAAHSRRPCPAGPGPPAGAGHRWRWPGRPRSRSPATHTTRSGPPTGGRQTRRRLSTGGGWPGRSCGPSTAPPLNASTAAQIRGSRCWRSRASANNCNPVRVETPSAAANGSGVNAATSGVPSPPRASSVASRPGRPVSDQVTNPDSAVAGCSTHHCAASRATGVRPIRRSGLRPRRPARAATPRRGHGTSTGVPFSVVSIMSQSKQTPPTVGPGIGAETGVVEKYFRVFRQPRWLAAVPGCGFRPTRCGCALAFGYACVDGVADPARFHSRR